MEFKNSRTAQNLLAAFSGESMARNKYLFFAEKARQEGHDEVAELYERMAQNEGIHGKLLFQHLNGVGTTSDNLQSSIRAEFDEWKTMYPEFAQIAREEGYEDIANLFESIGKIEKNHEYTFMETLARLHSNAPAAAPAHDSSVTVNGYRCAFCGATYETRPDVCSVCRAIGSFEPATFQKNV